MMGAKEDIFVQIRLPVGTATDLKELAKKNRTSVTRIVGGAVEVLFGDRDLEVYQQYLGLPSTPAAPPEETTNSQLISELVSKYRVIPGTPQDNRGDYPMIGRLYNQYGYDQVLLAIERLGDKLSMEAIREPLAYLAGILAKGGARAGGSGEVDPRVWNVIKKLRKEEDR